jgi:hypothetical protein
MIQRIQSLYLLVSSLISGGLIFLFSFWTDNNSNSIKILDTLNSDSILIKTIGISFFASALLSLYTIFVFKDRKKQFVLGRINILINFYLLGVLLFQSLNVPGELASSEKGIGIFTPVIVVILLVMANKAIKKDEDLVKSVDRLR